MISQASAQPRKPRDHIGPPAPAASESKTPPEAAAPSENSPTDAASDPGDCGYVDLDEKTLQPLENRSAG